MLPWLFTQTEDSAPLKLVVNQESNKVIFAEAGKDFDDVLFSFLTFPLGTITRLLQKDTNMGPVTIGCLNSLYQTVTNLDKECMKKEISKEMLLQPSHWKIIAAFLNLTSMTLSPQSTTCVMVKGVFLHESTLIF